ncbi:MFS transporter [Alkalihalobacillus sp. MEB130]|uniref:MFS transporter n=1 Tax=Alkalihalobacillus sp. MEB130 TaxID=2976704 RepID=UPI0028DF4522|nr:MFS transporter [Alkalihalobacillus sp. MEB130]MDT8861746.1 MFS transporter [Alkalihalobacillus sp. MEB130]
MKDARPSYILFFIGLLPLIMVIGNSMFIPLLPQMQADLGITTVESGWLLTSFSIPAALLVPVGGFLSDRFGRKKVALLALPLIMIGCVIAAISAMVMHIEGAFQWMLVGRVFQGIGAGGVTPLAMAFISDVFEGEQRNRALGTVEVFNGAGKVISPIIGGFVLLFSWNYSFVIYLAVSLFAFLGVSIFIKPRQRANKINDKRSGTLVRLKELFRDHWRWLTPICTSGFIGMFLLFGYLFYLAYLLEVNGFFSSIVDGGILALPLLLLTVLSYGTARKLKGNENNYKRAFIYGGALMATGTCMMIILSSLSWFILSLSLYSIGLGMVLPAANSALASIVSQQDRGTIFSLYSMLRFLGVALGPLLFGYWISNVEQMLFTSFFFVTVNILIWLVSWKCFPLGHDCPVTDLSRI